MGCEVVLKNIQFLNRVFGDFLLGFDRIVDVAKDSILSVVKCMNQT